MPVLNLDGDATGAVKAAGDAIKAQKEIADAIVKTTSAADKQERSMKRLFEDAKAPAEKYKEQLQQIDEYCNKHAVDEERRAAMIARVKTQYEAASSAGEQSFGSGALGKLVSYATGIVSIGSALALARAAMRAFAEERDKSLSNADDYTHAYAKLFEYGEGNKDPNRGKELVGIAEKLHNDTGVSRAVIGELVAKAEASDTVDELQKPTIKKLIATGMLDAGGMDAIEQVRMSMGKNKVSFDQVLQTAFAAATLAPGQTKDVLAAMSPSMLIARNAGYGMQEVAAFNAVVMKTLGVPEGGTAAANAINKLPETLKAYRIKSSGNLEEDLFALLSKKGGADSMKVKGDKEESNIRAKKALLAIGGNREKYEKILADEQAGHDYIGGVVEKMTQDTIIGTTLNKLSAEAGQESSVMSSKAPLANIMNTLESEAKKDTGNGFLGSLHRTAIGWGTAIQPDEALLSFYLSKHAKGEDGNLFGGGQVFNDPSNESNALNAYSTSKSAVLWGSPADREALSEHYGLGGKVAPEILSGFVSQGAPTGKSGYPEINPAITKAFQDLAEAIKHNTAATTANTAVTTPANRKPALSPLGQREN